jgi:hypothetical protein
MFHSIFFTSQMDNIPLRREEYHTALTLFSAWAVQSKARGSPNHRRKGIATYSVFEVIWGPTDQQTDQRTNIVSCRGATSRLKSTNPTGLYTFSSDVRRGGSPDVAWSDYSRVSSLINHHFLYDFCGCYLIVKETLGLKHRRMRDRGCALWELIL